jgi:hypothetical protein
VAARSKAWTLFARSNTGIVGLNPTQGTDVCLRLFCVCVGSGLAAGWSPVQGPLPSVLRLRNWSETKRLADALCSKWEKDSNCVGSNTRGRNAGLVSSARNSLFVWICVSVVKWATRERRTDVVWFGPPCCGPLRPTHVHMKKSVGRAVTPFWTTNNSRGKAEQRKVVSVRNEEVCGVDVNGQLHFSCLFSLFFSVSLEALAGKPEWAQVRW